MKKTKKKKVGKPLQGKKPKKVFSARLEDSTLKLIKKRYNGSIQAWVDSASQIEIIKATRKK